MFPQPLSSRSAIDNLRGFFVGARLEGDVLHREILADTRAGSPQWLGLRWIGLSRWMLAFKKILHVYVMLRVVKILLNKNFTIRVRSRTAIPLYPTTYGLSASAVRRDSVSARSNPAQRASTNAAMKDNTPADKEHGACSPHVSATMPPRSPVMPAGDADGHAVERPIEGKTILIEMP
jgi:hypothetical protein